MPARFTRRCSVSGIAVTRSEERTAIPALSPGGLAPVVRAHPHRALPEGNTRHRMARRRLPHPKAWSPACHSRRTPEGGHRRTRPCDPRRNRLDQASGPPIRRSSGAAHGPTSQQAGRSASGQTDIASIEDGQDRSEDQPSRRPEGRRADAEAPGARWCPRCAPRRVSPRRESRSPRATRAGARGGHPRRSVDALAPKAPKRSRDPAPVEPGGRWSRTCRCSRQRTFPKTRSSR